jgi:hypothetical protein
MHITRGELEAALNAAHARRLKITGHLCSIGFREAAALGIDNLEHGIVVDTEFLSGKQPDVCPPGPTGDDLSKLAMNADPVQQTIRELVQRNVAVTSTLAVFEVAPPLAQRFVDALAPDALRNYLLGRERLPEAARRTSATRIQKELEFERAFFQAGGLLVAGCDPTGNGTALAGFGDQRNLELLVSGGFTPIEAIQIATLNGADFWDSTAKSARSPPASRPTWWSSTAIPHAASQILKKWNLCSKTVPATIRKSCSIRSAARSASTDCWYARPPRAWAATLRSGPGKSLQPPPGAYAQLTAIP